MNRVLLLVLFLAYSLCQGQYQFQGDLGAANEGAMVYLSLVEDFRKSARPYTDQLIQKTTAGPDGRFSFSGDHLHTQNRVYRVHIDNCPEAGTGQGHFMQQCNGYQAVLFIASNQDTIQLPASFDNQVFCEISSTNTNSSDLLEADLLKEEMAFDLMALPTPASMGLKMKRWQEKWREFGLSKSEPLTELYIYAFLSDRGSETRASYLEELAISPYYEGLAQRLQNQYPDAPFTRLYTLEFQADQTAANPGKPRENLWTWVLGGLLFTSTGINLYLISRKKRNTSGRVSPTDQLTAQERRIAQCIAEDASNKEIATALFISVSTVKTHINSLYKKMQVSSREELKKRMQS